MKNRFYGALLEALERGRMVTMASGLAGEYGGRQLLGRHAFWVGEALYAQDEALTSYWENIPKEAGADGILETEGGRILLERICAREQLVICGGGHVAHPLARLGAMLNFDVTVLDDRADFANEGRFPEAARVICAPYGEAMQQVSYGENCYFVIVTPGHAADRLCLEQVLDRNSFGYVGMIGSRRKTAIVMEELARQGREPELLKRVHAPIGLRLGGQTPAEIAVSIAAELISVRAGREGAREASASHLPAGAFDREGLLALAHGECMMLATVVEKHGSAPRGVGARLMVNAAGVLYGTTGGGAGEAGVLSAAADILAGGETRIMQFSMNNDDARRAGMICGGDITVLLERVNGGDLTERNF